MNIVPLAGGLDISLLSSGDCLCSGIALTHVYWLGIGFGEPSLSGQGIGHDF